MPTVVGNGGAALTTDDPSVTLSAGSWTPAANDVVVLFISSTTVLGVVANSSLPSGWVNPLGDGVEVNSDSHGMAVLYHVVTEAEALAATTTYTATNALDAAETGYVQGVAVRGVDQAHIVDGFNTAFDSGNTVTPHVLAGITGSGVLRTGSLVISSVAKDATGAYSSSPGGWTQIRADNTNNGRWVGQRDTTTTLDTNVAATNITPSAGDEYCSITLAFSAAPIVTDVESDEDVREGDTAVTVTGTGFGSAQGTNGKVELWSNFAGATKVAQTVTSWSATAIDITVSLGAIPAGSIYVVVTADLNTVASTPFAVMVRRAVMVTLSASADIDAGGEAISSARLTGGTGSFVTGRAWDNENGTDTIDLTSNAHTEVVWSIAGTAASDGFEVEFRVTNGGTVFDTYTVTPSITFSAESIVTGTGTGTFTFSGSASGKRVALGQATGTLTLSGTVAGDRKRLGTAAGALTYAGLATGDRKALGTATGTITFAGTASGHPYTPGSGLGALTFTGTAAGDRVSRGVALGTLTLNGTVTADRKRLGTAAGTLTYAGLAAGDRVARGTALGTITFAGTASGIIPGEAVNGTGLGQFVLTGTASGDRVSRGTALGTLTYAGLVTGLRTRRATAAGTLTFSGHAAGTTSGEVTGTALGALTFSGLATGDRKRIGVATGTLTYTGAAAGDRVARGTAGVALTFTGTASGDVEAVATAAGALTFTGAAAGDRVRLGTALCALTFAGHAQVDEPVARHPLLSNPGRRVLTSTGGRQLGSAGRRSLHSEEVV